MSGDQFGLKWSETALSDLERIIEYIAFHDSLAAAVDVHDTLLEKIDALAYFPRRCRVVPELKEIGVARFCELLVEPHRVCFFIEGDRVCLVAVVDGRRDLEQLLVDRALATHL